MYVCTKTAKEVVTESKDAYILKSVGCDVQPLERVPLNSTEALICEQVGRETAKRLIDNST